MTYALRSIIALLCTFIVCYMLMFRCICAAIAIPAAFCVQAVATNESPPIRWFVNACLYGMERTVEAGVSAYEDIVRMVAWLSSHRSQS